MTTYKYLTDTGTISVDTATLLSDVQAEFQSALGADINLAASTPQGSLITAEVIARTNVMKNNAELANMVNPNLAYGTFLDAIASLLGVTRGTNKSTVATGVEIVGTPFTVIPAGSQLATANNDVFVTVAPVTIPVGGTTTATIQSKNYGPVTLPTGALTIIDGTIGWASATVGGGTSTTLGSLALTDTQLKNLRTQQLAVQGVGSSAAIKAALLNVPNVTSVQVVENYSGAAGTVNGVNFTLGNAVWVCVAGTATDADIAAALYNSHHAGIPWDYGTSSGTPVNSPNGVTTTDPSTNLNYNVKWVTPVLYDCYVHVTVKQSTSAASPAPAVQTAIMNYANGLVAGEQGFVVGAPVSAFELAGAVASQLPGMYVKECSVACVIAGSAAPAYPADYSSEFITAQFAQAVLQIGNITVQVV